jgi:hypothetical protein
MNRLLHYSVAFLIVVALKAVWTWALLSALPLVHRDSVTVNAPNYTAVVQEALLPLHIPDLKIVEREPLRPSFLLAVLMEGPSVASTLALFFAALWLVRRFSTKPARSNQPLEPTAGRRVDPP